MTINTLKKENFVFILYCIEQLTKIKTIIHWVQEKVTIFTVYIFLFLNFFFKLLEGISSIV